MLTQSLRQVPSMVYTRRGKSSYPEATRNGEGEGQPEAEPETEETESGHGSPSLAGEVEMAPSPAEGLELSNFGEDDLGDEMDLGSPRTYPVHTSSRSCIPLSPHPANADGPQTLDASSFASSVVVTKSVSTHQKLRFIVHSLTKKSLLCVL